MEAPQHNIPIVFSEMLQMFPNIPHHIVWMYVQQYSNDTEKCAQMLNLQCGKYAGLQSSPAVNGSRDLDELVPPLMKPIEITCDFNSDSNMIEQLPLPNMAANDINENVLNNHQSVSENEQSASDVQNASFSKEIPHKSHFENSAIDCSSNLIKNVNYQKPLTLTINIDDDNDGDGCSHSWRPKFSENVLSSDFFMPSPTVENFQFSGNQMSNFIFERNMSGIEMNPEGVQGALNAYLPNVNTYGINAVANHLHFQKSQMNGIRYEVIKAKIELSDVKESIEKLTCELNEKMQSKSAQDIEKLNDQIVQLRMECQCLCTEVDFCKQDKVLLGEVNENCYHKEDSSSKNAGMGRTTYYPCGNSPEIKNTDASEEPNKWQCPKCTFDNHPAISVCEMCHLPRPCAQRLPYMRPPPDACFCHPKKESLPVQS